MEKTNKCVVHYICVGSQATCKYFEFGKTQDRLSKSHNNCEYGEYGYCTNKQAQEEAKMKELEKPKIKFEVGKWYTTNLGFQVEFIRDIKRDGQYNVFRHTKENDYRPYYADENGVECDGDYIITESNPPKRKPLPDGSLPMTKEELEEFSKINGFTVKDVQYDGTYIHLNKRDYMGLCYVKAILYLANLFDLEV